jgi:hypothetical protein
MAYSTVYSLIATYLHTQGIKIDEFFSFFLRKKIDETLELHGFCLCWEVDV